MLVSEITARHIELARNEHLLTRQPSTANHWLRIISLVEAVRDAVLAEWRRVTR